MLDKGSEAPRDNIHAEFTVPRVQEEFWEVETHQKVRKEEKEKAGEAEWRGYILLHACRP